MANDLLTPKQLKFLELYQMQGSPAFGNATEAYRRSYDVANMKETTIGQQAHKLINNPKIASRIKIATDAAVQAVEFDRKDVMRHLVDLATADPTKVMQHRRVCCRHCHGVDHAYQWRDPEEYWDVVAKVMDRNARDERSPKRDPEWQPQPIPSNTGGYGWRRPNKPHPDCPRCFGEGEPDVWIADTSTLTGPERRLIAGIKQTRDGLEVKLRDQDGALNTIAQILKMLVNKSELSGPDGGPIPVAAITAILPMDEQQAAQMYQQLIEGKTK